MQNEQLSGSAIAAFTDWVGTYLGTKGKSALGYSLINYLIPLAVLHGLCLYTLQSGRQGFTAMH